MGPPARRSLLGRKKSSWRLRTEWSGNNWDEPDHISPAGTEKLAKAAGPDRFILLGRCGTWPSYRLARFHLPTFARMSPWYLEIHSRSDSFTSAHADAGLTGWLTL